MRGEWRNELSHSLSAPVSLSFGKTAIYGHIPACCFCSHGALWRVTTLERASFADFAMGGDAS